MNRLEQLMAQLSKIDRKLTHLYKRNRILNYEIQQVQRQRMAIVKKIEDEQYSQDISP